jgi:hypothetical protein
MLDAVPAVLLVEMKDGFGVALGAIAVTTRFKIGAQVAVVVNFSVVNDPKAFVLVRNGLVTCLEVNDAEPPHRQSDVPFHKKAVIVRPTMLDSAAHLGQRVAVRSLPGVPVEDSADSTHGYLPVFLDPDATIGSSSVQA